jgi:hypothetical protein
MAELNFFIHDKMSLLVGAGGQISRCSVTKRLDTQNIRRERFCKVTTVTTAIYIQLVEQTALSPISHARMEQLLSSLGSACAFTSRLAIFVEIFLSEP